MANLADEVIDFIEHYCKCPEGKLVGQRMQLLPFQRNFIRDLYRPGIRRAYLSVARKSGKSSLIAAIVLAHLVGPAAFRNSQIVSGARSEEQAALVYRYVEKIISQNEELQDVIRITRSPKMMTGIPMNVEYRPISAKASTAMGLSPRLAILDEVGQIRGETDEFVSAVVTAGGAYDDARIVAISTQAASDEDLFSIWLDSAKDDPGSVAHIYAAPIDADVLDETAWDAANPALGVFRSRAELEAAAVRAHKVPAEEPAFRNLYLNQRIEAEAPYVSASVWEACAGEARESSSTVWYGGLDLAFSRDMCAYVRVGWQDGELHVLPRYWMPGDGLRDRERIDRTPYTRWAKEGILEAVPGATVDFALVAAEILKDLKEKRVSRVAFDRWGFTAFSTALLEAGGSKHDLDKFVPYGQGFVSMSPALRLLDEALYNERLRHGGHEILRMNARNAVVQIDPAGNRKLTRKVASRKIDGMVALAMAVATAGTSPRRKLSIYEDPAFREKLRW